MKRLFTQFTQTSADPDTPKGINIKVRHFMTAANGKNCFENLTTSRHNQPCWLGILFQEKRLKTKLIVASRPITISVFFKKAQEGK